MTVIRGTQLTMFDVAPDGESFSIHVTDDQGHPATLVLPSDCLNALLMTLPEMVNRTLQARFHGQLMRVVYPVGSWSLDPGVTSGTVVLTLRTLDGFAVSFGLARLELSRMWRQSASTRPGDGAVAN